MSEFTFYTDPKSRGQIARWALHEAGADYEAVVFSTSGERPPELVTINPMNKVPALVHHHGDHDHVVTETAAICHYLAETHPNAKLLPDAHERAAYTRWLFFGAGPLEQALSTRMMGLDIPPEKAGMAGFGSLDLAMDAIGGWLETHDYVAGARFTMADVYAASQFVWSLRAGLAPERPALRAYVDRCTARPKAKEALAEDEAAIREQSAASSG